MSSILKDHPEPVGERRADLPDGVSSSHRPVSREAPARPHPDGQRSAGRIEGPTPSLGVGAGRQAAAAPDIAPPPAERAASIAVLAFTDMSAAKDQDWFCDGIAEEILNALTPLKGLRVAARTSAFSFKGKGDDLRTIGEKLNVTTVLEGSVRRAGDRVRITVQLSDGPRLPAVVGALRP